MSLLGLLTLVGCGADAPALDGAGLLLLEELGPPQLTQLDPATGQTSPWFAVTSGGFAYGLDVRPDGQVALSYTAPATDGGVGYDRSQIVSVDEAGALVPLAGRDAAGAWALDPAWAGDRLWFTRVDGAAELTVAFVDPPEAEGIPTVAAATEPASSTDGSRTAWVAVSPETGLRSLELGDTNGAHLATLVPAGALPDLGRPVFSVDGAFVYVIVPTPVTASLVDWLVPVAEAHGDHDVPADWWRVSTADGEATQLTALDTVLYDGRPHPGGRWFATATREGVVLVDLDTGASTLTLATRTVRDLDWTP